MMDPYDIPGISLDVNWGAGMIRKGLNGSYRGPCERALKICEQIIAHPLFFEPVWEMARVEGDAKRSLAALIMWLARGRPVRDAHDGIRGGSGPVVVFAELTKIISEVERVIDTISAQKEDIKNNFVVSNLEDSYIPTREDFENALRRLSFKETNLDELLNMMQKYIEEVGYRLHRNWRSITEENILKWSRRDLGLK